MHRPTKVQKFRYGARKKKKVSPQQHRQKKKGLTKGKEGQNGTLCGSPISGPAAISAIFAALPSLSNPQNISHQEK